MMLLENLVTRRASEENASKSSLTRRVTKQGHSLLAALSANVLFLSSSPALIFPATDETILRAAALLADGQLVGIPTETVYGLAANAWDAAAVRKIFIAKSRPPNNPLIVHVASIDRLCDAIQWPPTEIVQRQLDAIVDLWPGPLTVVCARAQRIPDEVTAGSSLVAVRIPAHDVALALLDACDFPIAAPSANRSQYISPTQPEHLFGASGVSDHIAMVLDGGPCRWGVESTIIKLGDANPTLLRPGAISHRELANRFGIDPDSMLFSHDENQSVLLAPGMMREHYSPTSPLTLIDDDHVAGLSSLQPRRGRVGRIAFAPISASEAAGYAVVETLSSTGDFEEIAHELFAAMRRLDELQLDAIHCDTCSPVGLGHTIMDRLRRAAARRE